MSRFSKSFPFFFIPTPIIRHFKVCLLRMSSCSSMLWYATLLVMPLSVRELSLDTEDYTCNCVFVEKVQWVGPYCSKWIASDPPFCLLGGGSMAKSCSGAMQWGNESIYWTEDIGICNRSSPILENCTCEFRPKVDFVGPYCSNWIRDDPPFCILSGGKGGRFCPGAAQWGNGSFYWTKDNATCARSEYLKELHSCTCAVRPEVDSVGPYCAKWIPEDPPYCYLSGGPNGRFCPGAVQSGIGEFYWTEDNATCAQSQQYVEGCRCGYYETYQSIGPYCSQWIPEDPPFCLLAGARDAQFCPGASETMIEGIYWTENESICAKSTFIVDKCQCEYQVEDVGPFCARWSDEVPPFCFLAGRNFSKFCPGAKTVENSSLYYTFDRNICAMSQQRKIEYMEQNCSCGVYDNYPKIGPWCQEWFDNPPLGSVCLLQSGIDARFCPKSLPLHDGVYITSDETICNRSNHYKEQAVLISLSARQPFEVMDIITILLYSLAILIGTIGNASVIKYFAFSNISDRPGSRFVVVLAGLDFFTSMLVPSIYMITNMYYFEKFTHCPFGGTVYRSLIAFHPMLFYSSAWILVAISLERARAIYRPLARHLEKNIVILTSAFIIFCSLGLQLYEALHYSFHDNNLAYLKGTVYRYWNCVIAMDYDTTLINAVVTFALGIWLPMLVTVPIYVCMYHRLHKQAKLRKQNSSHDADAQMRKILRRFTIVVIVFYLCFLPFTLIETYLNVLYFKNQTHKYSSKSQLQTLKCLMSLCMILQNLNSCLNPVI